MRFVSLLATLAVLAGCASSQSGSLDTAKERAFEETTSFWTEGKWVTESRVLWSYDREGGEPTLALNQSREGAAWSDTSKEEWSLDSEGRQTNGTTYEWTDDEWSESGRMSFFYDTNGNKTGARRRQSAGGSTTFTNADSLASMFTAGLETERRFFRWSDGAWEEGLRQTSAYDAEGQETDRVHSVPTASGWEEQRRWTFAYDEEGQLTNSVVEQVTDGAWTPWLNQSYMRDANGNLTEIIHEEWTDSEWTYMMKNETRYSPTP